MDEHKASEGDDAAGAPVGAGRLHTLFRVVGWVAASVLIASAVGVFIAWRSLTAIERVPFDQTQARDRISAVPDERAEQFQAEVEAAETAALESELAEEPLVVGDENDLLGGARNALAGREVAADFEVPFATSPAVDDSVYDSYLLIGSDQSGALADVIIYVLNPAGGEAPIVVSLPRDLYLPNPCTRSNTRLNAALNGCGEFANGPELLGLMVEDFTGIPVDHFATVDFDGFVEVVDAFGGYEICVDHPVRDRKAFLELTAGCTQASGETVLAWVRSRQTQELVDGVWRTMDGVSDFSRQDRQQEVLLGIAAKLRSFASVTAFGEVIGTVQESVQFDEGLDFAALIDAAWDNRDFDFGAVERLELGFENFEVQLGELSAFVVVPTVSFGQALEGSAVALIEAGGA